MAHHRRDVPDAGRGRPPAPRHGRTYRFQLNADFTRFSTGERVTARNFELAIRRVADPRFGRPVYRFGSQGRWLLQDLQRVHAPRRDLLVVRLRRPARDLLARLSTPFFCAVHPSMASAPTYDVPVPAAGPYYIASWDRDGELTVLRRNPHYRGRRPRRPAVIRFEAAGEWAIDGTRRGRFDWFAARPAPQLSQASRLRRRRSTVVRFVAFDARPGKPFASIRLRRAVGLALDRAALASVQFPGTVVRLGAPTDRMLAGAFPGRQTTRIFSLRADAAAIERATRLVAAEGPPEVTLTFDDRYPYADRQAERVAAQLERIGLRSTSGRFRRSRRASTRGPVT